MVNIKNTLRAAAIAVASALPVAAHAVAPAAPVTSPTAVQPSPKSFESRLTALSKDASADFWLPKNAKLDDLKGSDIVRIGDYGRNGRVDLTPVEAAQLFASEKDPASFVWEVEVFPAEMRKGKLAKGASSGKATLRYINGKMIQTDAKGGVTVFDSFNPKNIYEMGTAVKLRKICDSDNQIMLQLTGANAIKRLGLENILLSKTFWQNKKAPDVNYAEWDGVYLAASDGIKVGGLPTTIAVVRPYKNLPGSSNIDKASDSVKRDLDVSSVADEFNAKLAQYCAMSGTFVDGAQNVTRTAHPLGRYFIAKGQDGKERTVFPTAPRGDLDVTFLKAEDVVQNTVKDRYGRELSNVDVSTANGAHVKFDGRYDHKKGGLVQARAEGSHLDGEFTRNAADASVLGGYSWTWPNERLSLKAGPQANVSTYERVVGPRNPAGVPTLSKSMTDIGVAVEAELEGRVGEHIYDVVVGANIPARGTSKSEITGIPQKIAAESKFAEGKGYVRASSTLPGNNIVFVSAEYLNRLDADQRQQFLSTGMEIAHYIGNELKGINILKDSKAAKILAPLAIKGGVVHVFRVGDGPKGSASEYRLGASYGF